MGSIGSMEILVILLVVLLLFGSKQLPQMAKNVGKGLREFQKATQNAKDEIQKIINEEDKDTYKG
ncbi:twin-arginine translocase TatA/TatE family subunit [bacterium]|nr:twin-arginine translocase TatA/TatE family subunit [bacterium]